MVDGNKLGEVGFAKIGTPYKEMDCQAFIEWCLRQCGCNKNLAGSNAWYRECLKNGAVMTPEECVKKLGCVPKGAFLFIWADDGGEEKRGYHDGLGNASHIGICTMPSGKGAIHSSASRGGVCESEFHGKTVPNGGWNRVGLWTAEVAYDYSGGVDPEPEPTPEPEPYADIATVYAENGRPVNFRKRASLLAPLIDKISCGEKVEVINRHYDEEWSKIKWHNKTGYMVTKFLQFGGADEDLVTIIIHEIPRDEAEKLKEVYGENADIVG